MITAPAVDARLAPKTNQRSIFAKNDLLGRRTEMPKARAPSAIKDPLTKTQLLASIAEETGLSRKDVAAVMDSLSGTIARHLKKRGAGQFTMPGLMKIKTVKKPATRARKGTNPFTGEETMFKAKPARTIVKVQPLKGLKDMAE
jgi:nucleoid DNA-binding protein